MGRGGSEGEIEARGRGGTVLKKSACSKKFGAGVVRDT